jgi:integrase
LEQDFLKGGQTSIESKDMLFWDALDEIIKRYYQKPRLDTRTGRALTGVHAPWLYAVHVKHFKAFWGPHTRIRDIKVKDIEDYKQGRLDTPVNEDEGRYIRIETVNRELQTLKAILRRAEINDWILVNPFNKAQRGELITIAEEEPPEIVILPEEEWRLLDVAGSDSKEFLALVMTALDIGARRGELVSRLFWRMIDFDAGIIRKITSFKGGRGKVKKRDVGMSSRVREILLDLKVESGSHGELDSLVFSLTNFRKRWDAIRKKSDLNHVTFNVLRHTFVTRLSTEEQQAMVGKIVGHSSAKTTGRYFNPTDEQLLNAASKVDRFHTLHPRPAVGVQETEGIN